LEREAKKKKMSWRSVFGLQCRPRRIILYSD